MNATFDQVTHLSNALGQAESIAKSHVDHIKKMEMAAHDAITVVSCNVATVIAGVKADHSSLPQKSKAEHKYFAECRKSGALMEHQGALQKTVEAQRVALEKSRTTEDSLHAQLVRPILYPRPTRS